MGQVSTEQLREFEAKHKRIAHVETEQGDIVVRKPTKAEWKAAYAAGLCDARMRENFDAADRLIRDCCVYPELPELAAMVDDAPGIVLLCLDPLLKLAGVVAKERAGK